LTTIQTKQTLENSNAKSPIYPDDVGYQLDLEGTFNIETLDFEAMTGRYSVRLSDGSRFKVCAVCGRSQPMNKEAMEKVDESLAEEIEIYRWDNNRCEIKHKPFRSEV